MCIGLALASKWDAIWYVLGLGRPGRRVGQRRAPGGGLARRAARRGAAGRAGCPRLFGLLPLAVYLATWSGWFFTNSGYDRQWAAQNGIHTPVIAALASFAEYRSRSSRSTSA